MCIGLAGRASVQMISSSYRLCVPHLTLVLEMANLQTPLHIPSVFTAVSNPQNCFSYHKNTPSFDVFYDPCENNVRSNNE